jgi:nucleoid-associated protein YgaU
MKHCAGRSTRSPSDRPNKNSQNHHTGHPYKLLPRILFATGLAAQLYGCAAPPARQPGPSDPFATAERTADISAPDRKYIVLGSKRYISGPYGDKNDIMAVIDAVKKNSTPVHISNRAVKLPNKPANLSLAVWSYVTPPECGGYQFHVYEGDQLQILQYDLEDGLEPTIIRDYTVGPTQFVAPGLWGPYDHTESTALEMCLLPGNSAKDGGGLMEGNYEIGWITNITDWKQAELGNEYASAVKRTAQCLSGKDGHGRMTKYHVLQGDSLSAISQRVYGNTSGWKAIYDANRDLIGPDPNTVPSGIVLTIP